jgi:CRP/FNR family transcriptional regulator
MKSHAECPVECRTDHAATLQLQHQAISAPAISGSVLSPQREVPGSRRDVAEHVHVFREGDEARRIYELINGAVMLYKLLPDGRRQIVELIGAGGVFGISSLPIYECSAETLVASQAISYDYAVVQQSRELSSRLTARLHAQFCAMHDHAMLLGRKSALERIASFVMYCLPGRGGFNCPGPPGDDDSADVQLGMTRQEIADFLGLTIETVSRAFSELQRRGIVMIDKREHLHVNDVCQMCRLTGTH